MKRRSVLPWAVAALAALSLAACGGAARSSADLRELSARNRMPHSAADVRFMTMMIPHHSQAVLFGGWAESHGAGRAVQVLAARMVVAQRDEIETMRSWLRDRGEPVPPPDFHRMAMGGPMDHPTMPGMLTDAQLSELDRARGADFDRLFLTYMIPHHQGALSMVDDLFGSVGGAQDDFVFKLASDLAADQEIEIERMQGMLSAYPPGRPEP
jgi:uncharacterized protein (DUF305 family)